MTATKWALSSTFQKPPVSPTAGAPRQRCVFMSLPLKFRRDGSLRGAVTPPARLWWLIRECQSPIRRRNLLIYWPGTTDNVPECWSGRDGRENAWKMLRVQEGKASLCYISLKSHVITVTHSQQDTSVVLPNYFLPTPHWAGINSSAGDWAWRTRQKLVSHLLEFLPAGKTPPSGLWSSESVAPRALTDG